MSAAAAAPLERDFRVISLIGVVHGTSHYYQLAFVTMLLIVFQPERPVIRGRRAEVLAAEAELDVEGLVNAAFEARSVLDLGT